MKESYEEDADSEVLEMGLIAHVLRKFSNDSGDTADVGRRIVAVISSIVSREHYQNPVLARIWSAVQLWSADTENICLAAELFEMFKFISDESAVAALIEMSSASYPVSTQAAVATALEIRERHRYVQEALIDEEARGIWIKGECEREDTAMPDEGEEW